MGSKRSKKEVIIRNGVVATFSGKALEELIYRKALVVALENICATAYENEIRWIRTTDPNDDVAFLGQSTLTKAVNDFARNVQLRVAASGHPSAYEFLESASAIPPQYLAGAFVADHGMLDLDVARILHKERR